MSADLAEGTALFAAYADAPNALGYCGPPGGIGTTEAEIRASARRFSGVWPYLQVLARLTGTADPLDARLVEAYWLGGELGVDPAEFGRELLAVIGPQAGAYWSHLTPELLTEAAPDHGFHVFGVYPWTRLLGRGMDEQPLHVLDSCRITGATVVAHRERELAVRCRPLVLRDGGLEVGEPVTRWIVADGADLAPGDDIALHWDHVCGRLTAEQRATLATSTARQLRRTNVRLRKARA